MRAIASTLLLASLLATAGTARAEEPPPRRQVLLLLRVLVYDRNLKARAGDAVRVAVAFRADDPEAEGRRVELLAAFEEASREMVAATLPIRVVAVPYRNAADFEARLAAARPPPP